MRMCLCCTRRTRVLGTAVAAILVVTVGAWLVADLRREAALARSRGQLAQIALALSSYESKYGSYPPICTTDNEGNPQHSWRALLIPHFGIGPVGRSYDCEQPWDSADNVEAAAEILRDSGGIYSIPYFQSMDTGVFAVVAPEAWPKERGGVPSRFAVVAMKGVSVKWFEPKDVELSEVVEYLEDGSANGNGTAVLTAGGAVGVLSRHELTFYDAASGLVKQWLSEKGERDGD